jgi:MFS family permease
MAYSVIASFIPELFEPEVRFTGASLAYQIGGIITSAPAPFLAALLYTETGASWGIALYIAGAALIGLLAITLGKERKGATAPKVEELSHT